MLQKIKHIYETKYKLLMIIPLLLLVLSLVQLGVQYATTGDFVNKGISLKGGSTITITKDLSISSDELEGSLQQEFPTAEVSVRTLSSAGKNTGTAIDSGLQDKAEIDTFVAAVSERFALQKADYSVEVVGSSLGKNFFRQMLIALVFSFLLMGIMVILYFRIFITSLMVILAAFCDIVITLAIFNLTGMKLHPAGIAALLMMIGYSVDGEVIISSRLIKRKDGTELERIYGALRTGWTMTQTTLVAVLVALIFVQSEVVKQIMLILLIGLLVDIIVTWIQNVGILRWHLEKKHKSSGQ
ncbi:MAG TPA: hypothetical protein VJA18_03335 [Candidatus Nanoarchaeia archaeon]|nr:hypothetical protein [Candidatus Nanoarchaeia archaeon]